jgi:hypothetical protein
MGFGASPAVGMQQGEDYSFPFYYANQGYDVWVVMSRGSTSVRAHIDASPDGNPETCLNTDPYNNPCEMGMFGTHDYFNITYDELGNDTIRAQQYIAEQTGFNSFPVVCMTTGCVLATAGAALNSEYFNSATTVFIQLSTMLDRHHSGSLMELQLMAQAPFFALADAMGFALIAFGDGMARILGAICPSIPIVCLGSRFMSEEYNLFDYDMDFAVKSSIFPDFGILITSYLHVIQQIYREGLNRYNFGEAENLRRYGSAVAPSYPIEDINVPVALFWATDDPFATPMSRQIASDLLGDNVFFEQIYPVAHTWM